MFALKSAFSRTSRSRLFARSLHLHEYQSMELLKANGMPVPNGAMVKTVDQAVHAYEQLVGSDPNKDVVMKAQILSGGRGLGKFKSSGLKGGVQMCRSLSDVKEYASKMLGDSLVTKQTDGKGSKVEKLYLAERLYLRKEMYLSIILDRQSKAPMFLASSIGGTSIETLAKESPELLIQSPIDVTVGPTTEQLTAIAKGLRLSKQHHEECITILQKLYGMFCKYDATQVEINPFCQQNTGNLVLCDIKMNFDDNAAFRQRDIFAKRDTTQEDSREVEASAYDLNYIGLEGSIGCLVNGAGLAMATMDAISLNGGSPANFLDVGGSAKQNQIEKAFEILNKDQHVKAILVNIFGGIMRCDVIAAGIIAAASHLNLDKPLVVRLEGTKVDEANELFRQSDIQMIIADSLYSAAKKAVVSADLKALANDNDIKLTFC